MKKRKDGRYLKVVTINGKKHYIYGETAREVMLKALTFSDKPQDNDITFEEVSDEWWEVEQGSLSPSTLRGYNTMRKHVTDHFGSFEMKTITTAAITKYYQILKKEGYAKKSVKNHKIVINRIFHYAIVQGYITVNTAREAELPRGLPEKKRKPAPPEEERAIAVSAEKEEVWLLPILALYTGMRKGELLGLKHKDIDLHNGVINVERSVWYDKGGIVRIKSTKTEAGERIIPILAPIRPRLEAFKNAPQEHFVFGGAKPLKEKKFRVLYKKFQAQTGITATLQQLRKSFATLAVNADVPPDVLKTVFGHRDISTTLNIYHEVRRARIEQAAEALNGTLSAQNSAPKS